MSLYLTVVKVVNNAGVKIAEHPFQINQSADEEPEHGHCGHKSRHDQEHDRKIPSPVFERPGRDEIPDDYADKGKSETVDKAVEEISPGNAFVSGGIFRGDTDHFVVEVLPGPGAGGNFLFTQSVFAAVEHTVKVEKLF